jgi:hypothetical protein
MKPSLASSDRNELLWGPPGGSAAPDSLTREGRESATQPSAALPHPSLRLYGAHTPREAGCDCPYSVPRPQAFRNRRRPRPAPGKTARARCRDRVPTLGSAPR